MRIYALGCSLLALVCAACGGGEGLFPDSPGCETSQDPFCVPTDQLNLGVPAAPTAAQLKSEELEINAGNFKAFFATSNKDLSKGRGDGVGVINADSVDLWLSEPNVVRLITPRGNRAFRSTGVIIPRSATAFDYEYADVDFPDQKIIITRSEDSDIRTGQYRETPSNVTSPVRGSLYYGFQTPIAALPNFGSATYSNINGGQLFLTDGRRVFGRQTDLTVDFLNGTVSGDLFNNIGTKTAIDFDLQARVSVINAPINGSEFSATSGLNIDISDLPSAPDPLDPLVTSVNNADLQGSFFGQTAGSLAGSYSGDIDVTYSGTKTGNGPRNATLGLAGIFRGDKK